MTLSAKCLCIQSRWSWRLFMMRSVSQLGNVCCSTQRCISRGSTSKTCSNVVIATSLTRSGSGGVYCSAYR